VQGNTPVSVGFNGQISILSANGSCETITGHYAPIAASAVDRNKGVFYTGDTDGIICQWDLATVTPVKRLEPAEGNADLMYVVHTGAISGVAVVAANGRLLTVGWDDKLNTAVDSVVQPNPASLGAQPSAIAAGSQIACIVTVAGLMVIPASGKIGPMISIPYEAQAVAVTADDSTVYVGGKDCKIYVYTVSDDSLTLKHTIENGHLKPIHCLALSNDGTKLASADERDVCLWDLRADYAPLVARGKWCFHVQRVTSLAWSADDSILASGGADDSIFLWSLQHKMTRVHYPYAHRGGVVSLHFLNAMKLLSTGVDSVVNLWDVSADVKAKFG
jgi:WD repeat-containing protein 1 (actin-interacting protein 1)